MHPLLFTATAMLLAIGGPSPPDILPPGHKGVQHELVLQPDETTAAWQFVAAPTAGFGVAVVKPGEPFAFSSKYGTVLHALPIGASPPNTWNDAAWSALEQHRTGQLPAEISSVPVTHPLARVLTILRVVAVTDREVRLEVVSEQRWDARGQQLDSATSAIPWLLGIAALGALALVTLARRKPPARPS